MLDQMIESKETIRDSRRGNFFLTTLVLVAATFGSGMVWSLFAKDLGIGNENLEFSKLVAPVDIAETAPPVPEPEIRQTPSKPITKVESVLPVRQANIARTDETIYVPEKVSVTPSTQKARPTGMFTIGKSDSEGIPAQIGIEGRNVVANNVGIAPTMKPEIFKDTEAKEPPKIKKPVAKPEKAVPVAETRKVVQSLGVINGKALSLPTPPYPAAAQAVRVSGQVNVQVSIDEQGRVTSAKAVSGHPLLRNVSENAARNARFSQTLLSNQAVKVTGIIIYNFASR